jgi:hypothetical protein
VFDGAEESQGLLEVGVLYRAPHLCIATTDDDCQGRG